MSHSCSHCGNNGHNSRTCSHAPPAGDSNTIMLFGVRVTADGASSSFRKSVSLTNLSQYDHLPHDSTTNVAAGYDSDDVVHASARCRERKRGVPWTEDEHKLFLLGLQKVGKGDWRGISRNFVKTRTPTQVASHAQKYYLRRTNHSRRRRRSSLFDITTDAFLGSPTEPEPHNKTKNLVGGFPVPSFPVILGPAVTTADGGGGGGIENLSLGPINIDKTRTSTKLIRPVPIIPIPPSSKMAALNLNLKSPKEETPPVQLTLSSAPNDPESSTQISSGFPAISDGGDSIISVA